MPVGKEHGLFLFIAAFTAPVGCSTNGAEFPARGTSASEVGFEGWASWGKEKYCRKKEAATSAREFRKGSRVPRTLETMAQGFFTFEQSAGFGARKHCCRWFIRDEE